MLTVIQAPISWSPLAWVALVPFIIACSPKANPRRLFLISYVISLCYWLGNLYWMVPVTIVGWIVFCLYTALLWPVLALCLRFCRTKKIPLFLAAAVLIVGVERMQGLLLGGFFWRFLAHSQYQNITLIQIADIFGAGGVSFLVAMVNGLLAELILAARQRTDVRNLSSVLRPLFSVGLVFVAVVAAVVYGQWRISQEDEFVRPGPLVASLQSNVPQSVKRSFKSGKELFDGLMTKSKAAVETGAELIVWPETMVQAILDPRVWPFLVSPEDARALDKALKEHSKDTAFLLIGAYGGQVQKNDSDLSLARYNSAYLYRPDGRQDEKRYDKIHLVPFGEVLPLRRSLGWFYELLMKLKFIPYNFDYSLDYGSEYTVFEMTGGKDRQAKVYKFGVMICYEGTVPAIGQKFALDSQGKKRLDWLVNISNDGWFVRFKDGKVFPSAELPQHAAVCAFRAVENRLAVLRSVNTGISCLIDSLGRIKNGFSAGTLPSEAMARTAMAGWFTDRMPIDKRTTFFSKYGEWLDFCCEFCVIVLIIVLLTIKFFRIGKLKTCLTGMTEWKISSKKPKCPGTKK